MKRKLNSQNKTFHKVSLSLNDLLGKEYTDAICAARASLSGENEKELKALARKKVDFFPKAFEKRLTQLLPNVGSECGKALKESASGATSEDFKLHSKTDPAPVSGYGYYRIGENGRLYFISKSEHYHAPLGHSFPGYRLIEYARNLGAPNATHNNTRGHITRLLEEELIRTAEGISLDDPAGLNKTLSSKSPLVLNRVLNLETGSLAAEAAIKMILSRFHQPQDGGPEPKYKDRIPVFVVLGNEQGGLQANYHGTTITAQLMRGMWPSFQEQLEQNGIMLVRAVRPNNFDDLEALFSNYEKDRFKIAGFFLEFIMMNYGAVLLSKKFVRRLFSLCKKYDVPTVADEIQTCVWSPELYMYREYGVKPTMVAIGKGFPGGEYPASRILFSRTMDSLPQFGALVTNGQEELSSLAYLITMRWAKANAEITQAIGDYYEERLKNLCANYPNHIHTIEGKRHLAGIFFHDLSIAKSFTQRLNEGGLDISVQTYKDGCPPSALTKLPLTAGYEAVDFVIERMEDALKSI